MASVGPARVVLLTQVTCLLVPIFIAPRYLADHDIGVARALHQDQGVDVGEALMRAEMLVTQPDFRAAYRTIEWALWSQPMLTGDEVKLLVAQEEGTP